MLHTSVTLPAPLCAPRGTRPEMWAAQGDNEKMFILCMLMEGFWEEATFIFF